MQIQINIPRPFLTLAIIVGIVAWLMGVFGNSPVAGFGGQSKATSIIEAQGNVERERVKQEILQSRTDILMFQMQQLEQEALTLNTPEAMADLSARRALLVALLKDKREAEKQLVASLEQLWEAQGEDVSGAQPDGSIRFRTLPIIPKYGFSAGFKDKDYPYAFEHLGLDLPTERNTPIRAPMDGIITKAVDNGPGYSYVRIDHENGLETLYGHVRSMDVTEGQRVKEGDVIARSGGAVGDRGTGSYSTGPHLHFEVIDNGVHVDPMRYLPEIGVGNN